MRPEIRRRKDQDFFVVEKISDKQFDMTKKAKIENWFADILFQDFLEKEGLKQQ